MAAAKVEGLLQQPLFVRIQCLDKKKETAQFERFLMKTTYLLIAAITGEKGTREFGVPSLPKNL